MRRDYSQRTFDLRGAFLSAGMSGLRALTVIHILSTEGKASGCVIIIQSFSRHRKENFCFFRGFVFPGRFLYIGGHCLIARVQE